jgi:hypothetical protein
VPLVNTLGDDAKAAYESARNLFEIGDFNGAGLKFKRAFELSNNPRLLWNMAACEKELHHYANAVVLVERFLREGGTNITAESRDNATATLAALRALTSPVTLTGAPPGAQIFVDAESVGTTPLAAPLVFDLGSHRVRMVHPDFDEFTQTVDGATGGAEIIITVSMKPVTTAHLTVTASPGDAISVDGKVVGVERFDGTLPAGPHHVRVTAIGKTPYETDVSLAARGTRNVQVTLLAEAKRAVWPWIVGGAALVTGATIGGYFLFKTKDEPGPYTSGGLGTVMLPSALRFR